mgnify:CR=1 FL=1
MIYDNYDELGKCNIKATRSDFTDTVGEEGIKDIIRKVFTGGNVRDTTEFITQRRLLSSYAATCELFIKYLHKDISELHKFIQTISSEYDLSRSIEQKTFYLWMLGLTKKGYDNIVRDNFADYQKSFLQSIQDTEEDIRNHFGELSGTIELAEKKIPVNWNFLLLLSLCLGSQTLSIRGSAKSMNGKLFEKLLLGTLLSIMGFKFLPEPPFVGFKKTDKLFWLSNMDENERETDATLVFNGIAISIDIGFIGKGNPEISLDKVTRFNRYKQISGIGHQMKTIIIVDTVAENSDLIHKAKRVDGVVLQMIKPDWTILFAKEVCKIFDIDHPLKHKSINELDAYFRSEMKYISVEQYLL